MSKRRINKQQSSRIDKMQKAYQLNKDQQDEILIDGLVITRFGKMAEIEDEQGSTIRCAIRPNLDVVVAGDRVVWQPEGAQQGVVVSIYPRVSVLSRPTNHGLEKPVAANITQLIIVIAPKPEISWPLLDSYLIIAELLQLRAVILINKTDLPCALEQKRLHDDYARLNYPIIMSSKYTPASINELQALLNHQVNVFVGQSGVGKSSIIAQLLPEEPNIITGDISIQSNLGKHTTTHSRYYHLPSGGALIDSPGVRQFSLWNIDPNKIAEGYCEFLPFIKQCKFRNCTHIETPHCSLIEALNNKLISPYRYENFISLYKQHAQPS
jgi:ribosome biogenesis GTPase